VQQTTDGGYIIAGTANLDEMEEGAYVCLIKTDFNGNTTWTRSFGSASSMVFP